MTHLLLRALASALPLADESVQCVVTSPPYWGLRQYTGEQVVPEWGCALGLEPTPELYVEHMVAIFREVRRVLRRDGTLWLNLGDSYAGSWGAQGRTGEMSGRSAISARQIEAHPQRQHNTGSIRGELGLKPKDLVGIPWMVAFALRADGWYLRSDIIWAKPNPMPESVTDRPTKAHEYLFLLTKSGDSTFWTHRDRRTGSRKQPPPDYRWMDAANGGAETDVEPDGWRTEKLSDGRKRWTRINLWGASDYFYDADAIREQAIHAGRVVKASDPESAKNAQEGDYGRTAVGFTEHDTEVASARNKRTVWTIPTRPYPGAHFATFPEELVEDPILAGTSPKACGVCGAPWERVTERARAEAEPRDARGKALTSPRHDGNAWNENGGRRFVPTESLTLGWRSTCEHEDDSGACVVLDPFNGSGTTGRVAVRHGRSYVGVDISTEYLTEQAMARVDPLSAAIVSFHNGHSEQAVMPI